MKPLFIGVLPNFEKDDYRLARELLFAKDDDSQESRDELANAILEKFYPLYPHEKIKDGLFPGIAETVFGEETLPPRAKVFTLDSARSSFYFALKNLGIEEDSEVILPSFTCVVLVNPVKWAGFKPVYVDIEEKDFNTSVESLLKKVTKKTRVILAQHTFGRPIDVLGLRSRLHDMGRNDIFIIEDLAHSFGGNYDKRDHKLGTKADLAITTFGVEKSITGIRGGALLVNYTDNTKNIYADFDKDYEILPALPDNYQKRILINPLFWSIATPLYNIGFRKLTLGKLLIFLGHKLNLLGIEIDDTEYSGGKPDYLPAKLPGRLAKISINQLKKLDRFNDTRRENAKYYYEILQNTSLKENVEQKEIGRVFEESLSHNFLRYPILLKDKNSRDYLRKRLATSGIVVGDWYKTMFYTDPKYTKNIGYEDGSCKVSEDIKDRILNLPTGVNVSSQHLEKIKDILLNI